MGGWYGLRKGYRGRFGMYLPPLLEALGKDRLTHDARNNRVRALALSRHRVMSKGDDPLEPSAARTRTYGSARALTRPGENRFCQVNQAE